MILSNLNDYCYIFEPNILKVVCEDVTNPTKEVTLTSNGITLKRNCINSICYFDMSVIFESYFNAATFALNYGANADDPFFKTCTFNIQADDEEDVPTVTKKLRWGAYQFDEVSSNADFSFPFWVGQQLLVNSSKNHDSSVLGTTISGVKTIPVTSSTQFTHEVKLSSTKVQTITYEPQTCPTGHYLQWVDAHGQIWHYMFYASREKQTATEIKAGESVPYYPLSLTDSNNGVSKVLSKMKQRTFGCFQSVSEDYYAIVQSILSSPIVKYYINSKWVGVNIKDSTVIPYKRGFVDIEFVVELPTDFIQTR